MLAVTTEAVERFFSEETLFRDVGPTALARLASVARPTVLPAGAILFSMGQPASSLHFVFQGTGLLVKTSPDGRQRILHRAIPGEMVGAVPFFDAKPYPASFIAESDSVALSLPRKELIDLFTADAAVPLGIIGGIVERLREMVTHIESLTFDDTEHRLWTYLVGHAKGDGDGFPRVIDAIETREHIAGAIGTVREVVSRCLSKLAGSGHLRIEGRKVVLLKALAGGSPRA